MRISRRSMIKGGLLAAGASAIPLSAAKETAATRTTHVSQSTFGYMLPNLPGFTSPTNQQLADLAQTQLDPDQRSPEKNTAIPSGYVYFRQFVDHDLVLEPAAMATAPVDPYTIPNGRTFKFDLDSVYGGGPLNSPQLYAADQKHFLVQNPSANGIRDLARHMNGSAILVDGRNDENEIISQLHTAFLMFHNRLADTMSFAQAQRLTIQHYQWVVLHD